MEACYFLPRSSPIRLQEDGFQKEPLWFRDKVARVNRRLETAILDENEGPEDEAKVVKYLDDVTKVDMAAVMESMEQFFQSLHLNLGERLTLHMEKRFGNIPKLLKEHLQESYQNAKESVAMTFLEVYKKANRYAGIKIAFGLKSLSYEEIQQTSEKIIEVS